MNILVNGKKRDVIAVDLSSALKELGYCNSVIATALNGEFVPNAVRDTVRIAEGDRLEVVAPMQGG
jgi:sulfur carrier protein